MYSRWIENRIIEAIESPFVNIIFGARQTGKSTLLKKIISTPDIWLDFSNPSDKAQYLHYPELLIQQCKAIPKSRVPALIVIDEAQLVPSVFDSVQNLYDSDKERWKFVLCGSSARKIRMSSANFLPGRSMLHILLPLLKAERPPAETQKKAESKNYSPLPFIFHNNKEPENLFPCASLVERLAFGELPGIACASLNLRNELLKTYSLVYIEEEIRREASIKNLSAFSKFTQLSAIESGNIINYARLAKDSGVSIPTIKSYFQLLEEMFIIFRIPAFSGSSRKKLLSTEKYIFFDLGVRHASAGLRCSEDTVLANPGSLFEQWVGLELLKRIKYSGEGALSYMRTASGIEIDYILELNNRYIPIEVKWTEHPDKNDTKHIDNFIKEHKKVSDRGFVICRCKYPMELSPDILAIPWSYL
ncbi:MAG TPA: hypothetical protein DD381_02495 [Lentisphaeria bacterium]|nr:MAG: hypothetical protein A2X47_08540 [Lentisphaerae bacterium GWF2_38_69]HBM15204.1 hypothetical protein [Lentisphaeria bacterium]